MRPQVAAVLRQYQANRGGNNRQRMDIMHSFCARRQFQAPRDKYPEMADALLHTNTVMVLWGPPDEITEDGSWRYHFTQEGTWYLDLEFLEGRPQRASPRKLFAGADLDERMATARDTTNKTVNHTTEPAGPVDGDR